MKAGASLRRVPGWTRVAAGWLLIAATLGGVFAHHDHSIVAPETESSSGGTDRFVTRHNPLSHASHWHAVIAVVHEQDCVACHAQRLPGLLSHNHQFGPVLAAKAILAFCGDRPLRTALPTSGSRAPPFLL